MHKLKPIIYLLILLGLNLSCAPSKADKTTPLVAEVTYADHPINTTKDTLKFSSGIRSILQDSKGHYWIGSHQEGVCLFDGKSFTYFTMEDGLSDNQVRTIQEDERGTIWFGTGNGVSSYNGIELTNHNSKNSLIDFMPTKEGNWTLLEQDLWFDAGNEPGVYRFDGRELTYVAFPIQGGKDTFNSYGVTGFSRGENGHLWIATYAAVFGYDGKSFAEMEYEPLGFGEQAGGLHVRSILEDSNGNLWVGNNGIGVLLKRGNSIINFSEKNSLIHANSSRRGNLSPPGTLEHVFAIGEDRHGNIWFGDRDTGAWKYDGESMTNYTVDEALSSQHIWEIYEDRKGALLFAMGNGGVYRFKGESFERVF